MGRAIVYGLILFLAVFVLSSALIFRNGGAPSEAVIQVSVHDLATTTENYLDQHVTTSGTLRRFPGPDEHFVLEDEDLRVAVIGYDRAALLALETKTVIVTGRFDFGEGIGRFIEAELVTAAR